jgi:hypothetical protein
MAAATLKKALDAIRKDPAQWERNLGEVLAAIPAKWTPASDAAFKTDDKKSMDTVLDQLSADTTSPAGAPPKRTSAEKLATFLEVARRLLQFKVSMGVVLLG